MFSPVSLGTPLKSLEAGDFILTEASYPPSSSLPSHAHELPSLTFVVRGYCLETVGRRPRECKPHSVIIKPAGEIHSNKYGNTGLQCLLIEVKKERIPANDPASEMLKEFSLVHDGALPALALRVYREFKVEDVSSRLAMEGLILEMLAYATRKTLQISAQRVPRWLQEVRDLCHEHFAEPISLMTLAQTVGIHPGHLARIFRKQYQCTVGEYVRRLRLEYAARELVRTQKSLTAIALEAGFYDQSHFTNSFKAHMGVTPNEFRSAVGLTSQRRRPDEHIDDRP